MFRFRAAARTLAHASCASVELWGCLAYSSNTRRSSAPIQTITWRSNAMNPLNNHRQSLVLGIVIALIIAVLIAGWPLAVSGPSLARWFHIVSGVFWIGLLYYFNVAQTPALADAAADKGGPGGAGITKYVAPRALFWFRWAALATWIGGAWLLLKQGTFVNAFTLGAGSQVIGVGAWLGTIMLLNVWGVIWPNQKK